MAVHSCGGLARITYFKGTHMGITSSHYRCDWGFDPRNRRPGFFSTQRPDCVRVLHMTPSASRHKDPNSTLRNVVTLTVAWFRRRGYFAVTLLPKYQNRSCWVCSKLRKVKCRLTPRGLRAYRKSLGAFTASPNTLDCRGQHELLLSGLQGCLLTAFFLLHRERRSRAGGSNLKLFSVLPLFLLFPRHIFCFGC